MNLKFKNQDFQTDAVNAVADLFSGQEKMQSSFSVEQSIATLQFENEYGVGNKIIIDDNSVLRNMNAVQRRWWIGRKR